MNPFMKKAIATLLAALAIAAGNLNASDLDLSTLKDAERIADQLYYEAFHESLAIPPGSEYLKAKDKIYQLDRIRGAIHKVLSELE
jgi:hypothetical protein